MLHRMFERAVRECYAVNTSRDTARALRVLLETGRANGYIFDDEWAALMALRERRVAEDSE